MIVQPLSTCTSLSDGALQRLIDRRGDRIAVVRGRVWLTQDADRRDIVLDAGQGFELDRPGLAIVQAFGPACIRVEHDDDDGTLAAPVGRDAAHVGRQGQPAAALRPTAVDLYFMARRMRSEHIAQLLQRLGAALAGRTADLALRLLRRKAALFANRQVVQC